MGGRHSRAKDSFWREPGRGNGFDRSRECVRPQCGQNVSVLSSQKQTLVGEGQQPLLSGQEPNLYKICEYSLLQSGPWTHNKKYYSRPATFLMIFGALLSCSLGKILTRPWVFLPSSVPIYNHCPPSLPSPLPNTKNNLNLKPFFGLPVGVGGPPLGIVLDLVRSICNLAKSLSAPRPHLLFLTHGELSLSSSSHHLPKKRPPLPNP